MQRTMLVHPGDLVILLSYAQLDEAEPASYAPHVVFVDDRNRIVELAADPARAPEGSGLLSGAG